jgi:serine/threonine protein kinase
MDQGTIKESGTVKTLPQTALNTPGKAAPGYSIYLLEQGISFSHTSPYLISGVPTGWETWLIHISIVRQQFDFCIRPILEFLKSAGLPFAIPADADQHNSILGGSSGFQLTGKVISIPVSPTHDLTTITEKLRNLTRDVIGPAIPCAFHLTSVIGVSYGMLFHDSYSDYDRKLICYGSATANSIMEVLKAQKQSWPFGHIRPVKPFKESRLLNRQYIPIETLKNDPKGNVIKALKINRIYNMQWCVLKQGRRYQSFDNSGRDATDRIKWQYRIHQHFAGIGILPEPIACFELQGDVFFAMEYKESVSLSEIAAQLSEGRTWRSMPVDNKRTMIGYLLQVARILGIFHEEGFVHHDVTAANFIVTETGRVFAIDIELCYDLQNGAPDPAYTLGTPGYMSPEQARGEFPSKKDDIYSFGALLVAVLTGILPNKLDHRNSGVLTMNLAWFIDSNSLIALILSCLNSNPEDRPALTAIGRALALYDAVLLTNRQTEGDQFPLVRPGTLEKVLTDGAKMLSALIRTFGYSELGTLVLLSNYAPSQVQANLLVENIIEWLAGSEVIELPEPDLHLFAFELSKIYTDKRTLVPDFMSKAIPAGKAGPASTASVSNGLAGKGLKLLYLLDNPAFIQDPRQLADIVNRISALQHSDGSWMTKPVSPSRNEYRVTGFSHGVAGITYFLLSYHARYGSEELRVRIYAALSWLAKQRRSANGRLTWSISTENKTIDPWLEHGFSGIALTFIKAYEVLGEVEFKLIASEALAAHPPHISSNYCSFGNGLAGLGEVYLEAYRVFGEEAWYSRASAVQGVLLHSCYRDRDQCYWLDGTQLEPTADFWTGNAGVLHFLLRFAQPHEISFPIHLIQ